MDLQFTKIESLDLYAAEAVVNANFNVHLERTTAAQLKIYQKTTSETENMDERTASDRGFDSVYLPGMVEFDAGKVVDYDFDASVYPKVVRIESYTEVTTGILTEAE